MNRSKLVARCVSIAVLSLSPAAFAADFYRVDPEHTSIIFSVAHTGLSYTYGMFREVAGQYSLDKANPGKCRFQLVIRADSLFTNNAKRDEHLRSADFFNVQQFPEIRFDSTRCEIANAPKGGVVYKVTGNLTIHGESRPISLNLFMLGEGEGAYKDHRTGFLCQTELKRSDFGMTSLLPNNVVGDAVGVTVSFEGALQQPQNTPPRTNPQTTNP